MSAGPELPSGTVTFLFTDIEGSTRLLKQLREAYAGVLARHQELLRAAISEHRGHVVDTQGDAFFVVFRRAKDAVSAAVAAQKALAGHRWPDGVEVRVRMGIHTGQAEETDGRYHGLAVHRASRIGSSAYGGQVLVSQTTRDLLDDEEEEAAGVSLRDLGEQHLRDLDRPVRLYQLEIEGLPSVFPPLRPTAATPDEKADGATTWGRRRLGVVAIVAVSVAVGAVAAGLLLTRGAASTAQASAGVAADSVGVFDAETGRLVAQTLVQAGPAAVASGDRSIWVANVNDDSVSRIDPETETTVQRRIPVGSGPAGIAVGGGYVWVANSLDGTVSKIDPATNSQVDVIGVGNQPTGITFGLGGVWVANSADGTIQRIDPVSGTPAQPITIDSGADALAAGDGELWVASETKGIVSRVDPASGAVSPVNVGTFPGAVVAGAGVVWVANSQDGTIMRIDARSSRVSATTFVGGSPSGLTLVDKGVWVSRRGGLTKVDPRSASVVRRVETDNQPAGITSLAGKVFVSVRPSFQAHRGGTLTVLSSPRFKYEPTTDPAYLCCNFNSVVLTNDGLVGYRRVGGGEGTRLVPDLAIALPVPTNGGKTWVFQLRRRIRYSNGRFVRPADFRRAIERALANPDGYGPTFLSGIVGAPACIKKPKHCDLRNGIVADDRANTVTFHLSSPDPDLLYKLAHPIAIAVPSDTPLRKQRNPLPATGPYMFARYDAKHGIRLVRNPYFHEWSEAAQPNGYPDEIVWRFESSKTYDSAEVREVERHEADFAQDGVPAALLHEVNTRFARQVHVYPLAAVGYVFMNTRLPPFDKLAARQAVSYAIDRNRVASLPTPSGRVGCQVIPPGFFGFRRYCPFTRDPRPSGAYTGPDVRRARQLIAKSGTKGQAITFWGYKAGRDDPATRKRMYLVSVLRSLGYNVTVKLAKDVVAWYAVLNDTRRKVQVGFNGWQADYPAPSDFFRPLLTCAAFTPWPRSNGNYAWFCNPNIDAEIAQASALQTTDPRAAADLWAKIDRDVVDQAPWVVTHNARGLDFVSARVGNYIYNPQWGALFDQMWVK